jgi:hypothetical protein
MLLFRRPGFFAGFTGFCSTRRPALGDGHSEGAAAFAKDDQQSRTCPPSSPEPTSGRFGRRRGDGGPPLAHPLVPAIRLLVSVAGHLGDCMFSLSENLIKNNQRIFKLYLRILTSLNFYIYFSSFF